MGIIESSGDSAFADGRRISAAKFNATAAGFFEKHAGLRGTALKLLCLAMPGMISD
jgi:hypothetical protein